MAKFGNHWSQMSLNKDSLCLLLTFKAEFAALDNVNR
jgi:hypothetical protein